MMERFHITARKERERRGLSQEQIAKEMGVSQQAIQQFEGGVVEMPRYARKLAKYLGIDESSVLKSFAREIEEDLNEVDRTIASTRERREKERVLGDKGDPRLLDRLLPMGTTKDIPVYASAQAGEGEMIVSFETIERVRRPEPLANVRKGFGMYVMGSSMEPAYAQGDLILCHPHIPPRRDDDVLVIKVALDDGAHTALLKRYVRGDNDRIVLRQLNPPAEDIVVPRIEIGGIYVVVGKYNRR